MVKRVLSKAILKHGKKFPVISLTGPRQSGKSTLLQNLFPDYTYINLEDADIRLYAQEDPKDFLRGQGPKLIIDEVQRVPVLFNYLQGIVDKAKKNGEYILSGSQNFLMMENITQTLAGRVAIFKLLPFSYSEVSELRNKPKNAAEAIYKGFYPRLYDKKIDPDFFYQNYIETYIERDLRSLKNIGDLNAFTRFLKLCAGRTGQILNLQSLALDAGISQPTAKNWLSLLEASYIVFQLPSYSVNVNKRLIKSPKLYFYDTGVACHLLGIKNASQTDTHYLKGALFENLVIAEMYKSKLNKGIEPDYHFYRDSNQNEIDLLWQEGNKLNKAEIKYSATLRPEFAHVMTKLKVQKILKDGKQFIFMNQTENKKWMGADVKDWRELDF
jgi:predicted AAA+ superfamily ATPase